MRVSKAQEGTKKPAGLRRVGFQGWRNLNESPIYMKLNTNIKLKNNWYT